MSTCFVLEVILTTQSLFVPTIKGVNMRRDELGV